VRKSNISLLGTSTNEHLLQKLKSKKINHSIFFAFLECSCYIQNLVIRQKAPTSQTCVFHFLILTIELHLVRFEGGASYLWTKLRIILHTFAVVSISLHIRKYAILLHLAWLNSKKLGFTLFLLYSLWLSLLSARFRLSLLFSTISLLSAVNCTTATSYNYDATITFLIEQQVTQQLSIFLFPLSAVNLLNN